MLIFRQVSPASKEAQLMLEELNQTLMGILGHNGTKHVRLKDFEQNRSGFIVGFDDDEPVCCCGFQEVDGETAEVKRVYARPNRNGTGRKLMACLEEWAGERGYRRLILECRSGNSHALEFYRKVGYHEIEKFSPYDVEDDAVCFEKKLI